MILSISDTHVISRDPFYNIVPLPLGHDLVENEHWADTLLAVLLMETLLAVELAVVMLGIALAEVMLHIAFAAQVQQSTTIRELLKKASKYECIKLYIWAHLWDLNPRPSAY